MRTVFADTFYFLALVNPGDVRHEQASAYTASIKGRIVTTHWIIIELGDALAKPVNRPIFLRVLRQLQSDPDVRVIAADATLFEAGVQLFASRPDKDWSLTDCISFVAMQQNGISEALTGDHHFEQAGFVALLK
jgi:predicted nucleic acid-binding protein